MLKSTIRTIPYREEHIYYEVSFTLTETFLISLGKEEFFKGGVILYSWNTMLNMFLHVRKNKDFKQQNTWILDKIGQNKWLWN